MTPITLQAGSLVFYDSLTAGLVPCRIVTIDQYQHPLATPENAAGKRILLQVTATRGCYEKGREIDAAPSWVFPRGVRRVRGTYGQRVIVPRVQYIATRGSLGRSRPVY